MNATDTTPEPLLSHDEIALLNQARDVLQAFGARCSSASWRAPRLEPGIANPADFGRVHVLADVAEDAIFTTLNWANSSSVADITEDQLHNRSTQVEAVA